MPQDDRKRQKQLEAKRKKRSHALEARRESEVLKTSPDALAMRTAAWPLQECRINEGWQADLLASVAILRQSPNGSMSLATYLVDLGCLGVKAATIKHDLTLGAYAGVMERLGPRGPLVVCPPELAARVVLTGLAYAASLGFAPDPDFRLARHFLQGIDASACTTEVRCGGEDGRPFYIPGPDDDARRVFMQLARHNAAESLQALASPTA